jgi:uncharacterized protein
MHSLARLRRFAITAPVALATVLGTASAASAHARVSPAVSLAGQLQYYNLAVPTEKDGVATTRVVLTVPSGFAVDSFAPPPAGWTQQVSRTGSGENAVVTRVTWTGGHTPSGEDSDFGFLAQPQSATTYTFAVQQTYSDGSIVNWTGPESSDAPAPTISASSSLGGGGGGGTTLPIVALVVGALGLLAGGFALVSRGDRQLA